MKAKDLKQLIKSIPDEDEIVLIDDKSDTYDVDLDEKTIGVCYMHWFDLIKTGHCDGC